ncbi:MAG: hypothetical protein COA67_09040 [Lutibacter sp.]|nr:MAG: hypothetical protein COA67_09040 [Lutibacter sp.]
MHNASTQFSGNPTDSNETSLPPGLSDTVAPFTALGVGAGTGVDIEWDNVIYSGPYDFSGEASLAASIAAAQTAFSDLSNYTIRVNSIADTAYATAVGNIPLALTLYMVPSGLNWTGTTNTDWNTGTNWSSGSVPISTDDITIPNVTNKPIVSSSTNAVANDIIVDASSSVTVTGGGSLTLAGNLTNNGTLTVSSDASDSASLLVSGTSTGNITYERYVGTNWHLVTSPIVGQDVDAFVAASSLVTSPTVATRRGLGNYNNAVPAWGYYDTTAPVSANFSSADGYTVKRTAAGTVDYTGTLKTDDLLAYGITEGVDGWNLVGNPYPSYMDVNAFLTSNLASFNPSFANVYVWNGTAYAPISGANYMAPGQGFFVKSATGGASINITEAMQSHQTATFYKNTADDIEMNLSITDQNNKFRTTKINFAEGKTIGLDPMFDVGMFTATDNSFTVYSHLLSDSQGIDFEIQALPNSDYESVIIPIGINAVAGKEITFKVEDINLPFGTEVFLEDRENNTFTRLDEDNSEHTITVDTSLSGIGRFYLRTSDTSALSVDDLNLENVSIYKLDDSTLRIAGLDSPGEKSIAMFDILGQRILQESFNTNGIKDINLPNVSSGVYIIHLQTETGNLSKKIILN